MIVEEIAYASYDYAIGGSIMQNIRKKLLSKKTIGLIAVILVLMATIVLYQNLVETQSNKDVEEGFEKELAELFVKTMIYFNETKHDMLNSYYMIPYMTSLSRNEIVRLIDKYINLSKTLFIPENFPFIVSNQTPELQRLLWKSFRSYYVIANDTLITYDINNDFEEIMPMIAKSLTYLSKCEVEKGINEYLKTEPKLLKIINNLNQLYYDLSSIDEKTLLSNEHRRILKEAINTTSKILSSLTKYREIMNSIKNNPEYYKQICLYSYNETNNITQNTQQLLYKLYNMLKNLSDLGSATNSLIDFKNTVNNAYYKMTLPANNQNPGINQQDQNNNNGQGSGAGYHNLTETD